MTRPVVVDASGALSWVLPGEDTQDVIEFGTRRLRNQAFPLLVPPAFWYEVANALWVAAGRDLALRQEVSVYDAAYLQIVMISGNPLWTADRLLSETSRRMGLEAEPRERA